MYRERFIIAILHRACKAFRSERDFREIPMDFFLISEADIEVPRGTFAAGTR